MIHGRIKKAREALKLSQPEASSASGIPVGTLRKYEQGPSKPGADAIEGLVRLGINANWLLTGEGPMLLAQLRPATPAINVPALSAIIRGLIEAGAPAEKVGPTAWRYYQDAIDEGLITP